MKQILQSYKTGELWLAEVPAPACKSLGVVVQTQNSFVSAGTERMLVDFAQKSLVGKALAMPDQVKKVLRKMKTEGVFSTLDKVQAKLDQPIPLGYSCAGIVEEVGSGVAGLTVGDRVACGGSGYANHCEYNYIPKNLVVKIPEAVSFEDASCATVGSVALQGVRQCDLRLGETICVMGLGLLGLLAVQMLKASGARVIGFDPNIQRCQMATDLGAELAVSSNLKSACSEFSEGYGVDAVLITAATKSNEPVAVAGEICRMKGKVVVTGLTGMDIPRDMYYKKELDFKLSLSYGPGRYDPQYEERGHDYPFGFVRWTEQRNMKAFLDLVAAGTVTPSKLITHRFTIDDALNAYDLMMSKSGDPYLGIVLNYLEKPLGIEKVQRKISFTEGNAKPDEVTIGFIGAGNFTKAVLIPALKKKTDVALKAICTETGMSAEQTAQKGGAAYATTDYQQLLNDSGISTIFVTSRHDTHAHFVTAALEAGKHVFVEKPLCLNLVEMERIWSAYERAGQKKHLMTGFNRRFSPHAELIKDYFKDRRTPMIVNYRVNSGIIPSDSWIQDSEVGGGRIVGEVCHFVDFASYLIDCEPVEVLATCVETTNASLIAEDNVTIVIKYADGSIAQILYLAVGSAELAKERCEVHADESTAVMDDFCSTFCSGKLGKEKLEGKQVKGFTEELNAFLEAVKAGGETPISFQSQVETTVCSFAILESLRGKKVVNLKQFLQSSLH